MGIGSFRILISVNDNCKNKVPGKKGYPKFKKNSYSVEYKTTGWKLSEERKRLTLTDGFNAGTFKLKGSRNLHFYQLKQIKRIRIIKRADGYYAQFLIDVERSEEQCYTGTQVGLDLGLASFYTDSNGNKVDNPRYLRKSERQLNHLVIRLSRRYQNPNKGKKGEKMSKTKIKQSKRFHKARIQVVKKSLSVRTHCCPSCKTLLDRDENAALNILMKALEVLGINTVGHTGINAQGQTNPCLVGENLLGKLTG